jgi:hypothetical protein
MNNFLVHLVAPPCGRIRDKIGGTLDTCCILFPFAFTTALRIGDLILAVRMGKLRCRDVK